MKDKLLNAMREAAKRTNEAKRNRIIPVDQDLLIKRISDSKHFSKEKRLFDAMLLTAFGL